MSKDYIWLPIRNLVKKQSFLYSFILQHVPLGAWLLSRVDQQNVEVNEYDDKKSNVVIRSYVHRIN